MREMVPVAAACFLQTVGQCLGAHLRAYLVIATFHCKQGTRFQSCMWPVARGMSKGFLCCFQQCMWRHFAGEHLQAVCHLLHAILGVEHLLDIFRINPKPRTAPPGWISTLVPVRESCQFRVQGMPGPHARLRCLT